MTKTIAVDENNDMYLDSNGNIAIATGLTAILQSCQQAAQTLLGEMVLQTDKGIPYFEVVFNGTPNVAQFESALRSAFLAQEGVTQVISINIIQTGDPGTAEPYDTLGYTAVIDTIYGQGVLPTAPGAPDSETDLTSTGLTTLDYTYFDETGVIVPDTSTLLTDVTEEYKAIFGNDLNTNLNTPQGLLIAAEVLARAAVLANNAQIANQINPNLAGGVFLDAIYRLTGGERNPNEFTAVVANLTGVPGTVIPIGSQAQDSANGNTFALQTTVTLDSVGAGSGIFQCQTAGPVTVAANTLTLIVSGGELGWETVNNPAPQIQIGSTTQDDEQARNKRRAELARQGISLSEAIISRLNTNPGILSVSYRENYTSSSMTIDGITLIPNSIYVCVDGGEDLAIANILDQEKTAGCNYNGSVAVNVTDPFSRQVIPVKFDRPTIIQILVRVTVTPDTATQDPQTAIIKAILDYAEGKLSQEPGLIVGQSVSPWELAGAINREYPGFYLHKVEISLSSPVSFTTSEIPILIFQKAEILDTNIIVVMV